MPGDGQPFADLHEIEVDGQQRQQLRGGQRGDPNGPAAAGVELGPQLPSLIGQGADRAAAEAVSRTFLT
jgi:hypothetical protein